jgi:hypothetical protein
MEEDETVYRIGVTLDRMEHIVKMMFRKEKNKVELK